MNPEFLPLVFSDPQIRRRRRERRGFEQPPAIPAEERREIAKKLYAQTAAVRNQFNLFSPEQKRAVFLKLRHNRPLTVTDLTGTGLAFMTGPGETESLVVPRKIGNLEKLDKRIEDFVGEDKPDRPKGTEFATTVQSVEIGDPKDRLSEEVLAEFDAWSAREHVIYEIEAASFEERGTKAQREIEEIIAEINAALGNGVRGGIYEYELHERGAHIVLWTTGVQFREFVESEKWWRKIVYFDTRPRFETFHQTLRDFNIADISVAAPGRDADTICVIDSGVAAGNPFLTPILRRDISRSFIAEFEPTEDGDGHGSGVASLAAYHTIDISKGATNAAEAWVASARITSDDGQLDVPWIEDEARYRTAEARLFTRVLREIVQYYQAFGVKIFVLPYQVLGHVWSKAARHWIARNAWVARTIDQLSREFDVVFVTITGNISPRDVQDLLNEEGYPGFLVRPFAKLHDPGQAALALTVGSITHAAKVVVDPLVPLALESQPSPFTRSGPGFADSIKPDLIERGGNFVRDPASNTVTTNAGTDVMMASNAVTKVLQHHVGTSFAAPRVAYHLSIIARDLRSAGIPVTNTLLRAFIAASAVRPSESEILNEDENLSLIGYGIGDGRAATDCSQSSVLLFWQGNVAPDSTAIFKIPVPAELKEAGRGPKQIIVAVASAPEVQKWGVAEYLSAEMKFRLFRGDQSADHIAALLQRDEDEKNIAATKDVSATDMEGQLRISRRSVGTLQKDVFEWSDHKEDYSQDDYTLALSLVSATWLRTDDPIPIAVVVRIEDATGKYQELYARVRARVQALARVRA